MDNNDQRSHNESSLRVSSAGPQQDPGLKLDKILGDGVIGVVRCFFVKWKNSPEFALGKFKIK